MPIPLRWYCASLHRHHERDAFAHLRRMGFESCIPLVEIERKRSGRTSRVHSPTFPGYGFVRFAVDRPGWQAVWTVPYVKAILGQGADKPTPVPDALVDALMRLKPQDDPRKVPGLTVREGDTVEFTEGAWTDHRGLCIVSETRRAQIAVEIFGRLTKVEADPSILRVVRAAQEGKAAP